MKRSTNLLFVSQADRAVKKMLLCMLSQARLYWTM